MTNILQCRWCGWNTFKAYTRRDGQIRSGWPKLQHHIETEQEEQATKLAENLGVEELNLTGEAP